MWHTQTVSVANQPPYLRVFPANGTVIDLRTPEEKAEAEKEREQKNRENNKQMDYLLGAKKWPKPANNDFIFQKQSIYDDLARLSDGAAKPALHHRHRPAPDAI